MSVLEQVEDALHGKESVWVLLLTDALHEDGQVVMVVKLVHFNLPSDLVWGTVLNLDGQVSTVVEATELARWDGSSFDGTGLGGENGRLGHGLVQGVC